MENEITNKSNFLNNVENFIKNNIKILITFIIIIFLCFIGAIYVWTYSAIVAGLLAVGGWTFLSYLWGAKIWGAKDKK